MRLGPCSSEDRDLQVQRMLRLLPKARSSSEWEPRSSTAPLNWILFNMKYEWNYLQWQVHNIRVVLFKFALLLQNKNG